MPELQSEWAQDPALQPYREAAEYLKQQAIIEQIIPETR